MLLRNGFQCAVTPFRPCVTSVLCAPTIFCRTAFLALKEKKKGSVSEIDENSSLKRYKPTCPSLRHKVRVDRDKLGLWKGGPIEALTTRLIQKAGRNNTGRITMWHRGGGAQRKKYRYIDFRRTLEDTWGQVQRLEYDPNRSGFIALMKYDTGEVNYMLAPLHLKVGDRVISSKHESTDIRIGNCLPLKYVPIGTLVHNVELRSGQGGVFARAAGNFCQVVNKNIEGKFTLIRTPSKEERLVSHDCRATIGVVSNHEHEYEQYGKAGYWRNKGRRPVVRGCAMNPVDHPHGGRTVGGRPSVTPWGKPCKGRKTRRRHLTSDPMIIVRRPRNDRRYDDTRRPWNPRRKRTLN